MKNIIGNWWSHKILQAESQISPNSGSIKEQIVTFIGKENISINGNNTKQIISNLHLKICLFQKIKN